MKTYTRATPEPWSAHAHRLASVASTNALLHERTQAAARAGAPLPVGTSLRADFQTAGRGRHGRSWEGAPGQNLYVSYLLSGAGITANRLFALSQTIALAVRDTAAAFAPAAEALVKWPNDVFLDGRKVAGILVEASLSGEDPLYVVAGVGLNVRQGDFPAAPGATSLRLANPAAAVSVDEVWRTLTRHLEVGHARLAAAAATGDFYDVAHRYHRYLLGFGTRNRYVRLRDGVSFEARLKSVDAAGRLVLEHDDRERRYSMDEIRYRGPAPPG